MSRFIIRNADVRRNCLMEIQALPFDKFEVVVQEIKRSNQANNLYWKWVSIIAKVKGYTPDEMHDAFKRHFIGEERKTTAFGRMVTVPKSSKKLRRGEFSEYMTKVEAYAKSEGITLPSPDYYGLNIPSQSKETA